MANVKKGEITITMPKGLLRKWLAALRSGKYKQGHEVMLDRSRDKEWYCCLGVLQACVGEVESDGLDGFETVPSREWLNDHQVVFLNDEGAKVLSPYIPSTGLTADELNDAMTSSHRHKFGFKKIADFIQHHAKGL